MLTLANGLLEFALRTRATLEADMDLQVCCCFALLGLLASLAFLRICGPDAFVLIANAG